MSDETQATSQRKTPLRVRSYDVAELAGVSQSTVSRALAGSAAITEATRTRVVEAARKLGYQVDDRAARLRSGRTETIAVVVIGQAGAPPSSVNPFNFALLGSVCAEAADRGLHSLVSFQSEEERFFSQFVERGQADAVIVIGTTTNQPAWDYFRAANDGQPHMAFWGSPFDDHAAIRSDNMAGGRLAVDVLLGAGYRRIAFIGDTTSTQRQFAERYDGYCAALRENGLEPRAAAAGSGETRQDQGRAAIADLLDGGDPPDAVFAACDAMAFGAVAELRARGVALPQDFGIIGFDGLGGGALCEPPLTTIEPDFGAAAKLLIDAGLAPQEDALSARVPVRLIERASVRK